MPPASGRRTFLQTAALLTAAAAAEPLLRSASAHASNSLRRSSGDLVELHPALSEAAFPERNGPRPYRYRGPNLSGASGIAASHRYPGVFWLTRDGFGTHDDPVLRGYRSFLYAIRFDAAQGRLLPWASGVPQTSCDGYLKYLRVLEGGRPLAWGDIEDLALWPGAPGAPGTLYLGGIGNNANAAVPGRVHRCPEPDPEHATEVGVAATVGFWSQPDHRRRQANCESLFVADGVPYVVVKSCPGNRGLAPGEVLRLPTAPGPGGASMDAVPVARLQAVPGVRWGVNSRPNGADLRDGGLLLSTGTHWLRYQAAPGLHGDPLVRDLAARPPVEWGWWQRRGEACGNEAIGWLPASGSPSFLAVSEAGLVRWWPG